MVVKIGSENMELPLVTANNNETEKDTNWNEDGGKFFAKSNKICKSNKTNINPPIIPPY